MDMEAVAAALNVLLAEAEGAVLSAVAVLVRVGALLAMLPGFGERFTPQFARLGAALAISVVIWPLAPEAARDLQPSLSSFGVVAMAEAINGLLLGFSVRLLVFALQTAGTVIGMSFSLSQMFGPGVAPEPEPAISTALTLAGVTLAMNLGLHLEAVRLLIESYEVLRFGVFPIGGDLAEWSVERVAAAFNLAVSLALPFILAAFVYNITLGFINRAMPQMMVAFVGLPLITFIGLLAATLLAGAILTVWIDRLGDTLSAPLGY